MRGESSPAARAILTTVLVLATLVMGCKKPSVHRDDVVPSEAGVGAPRTAPPPGPRPDSRACAVDADCTFGFGLDADDCCLNTNGLAAGAQSAKFAAWAQARAASTACAAVKCPPLSSPQPPPPDACWNTPRCKQGRCDHACAPSPN